MSLAAQPFVKPLVYVAGPYTNPDPVENTHHAIRIGSHLLDEGVVTPLVPHLNLTWHLMRPRPYQDWLDYDLELMRRCDAVYRYEGESPGADAEVAQARQWGIPVFHSIEALYRWVWSL